MIDYLKKLVWNLENRREMYLVDPDYNSISTFLIGYNLGYKESAGIDIFKEFQTWLQNKEKKHFSLHWSAYILNEMAGKDQEKAIKMLFKLLKEFSK